jgi:phosphate acetyltransferase
VDFRGKLRAPAASAVGGRRDGAMSIDVKQYLRNKAKAHPKKVVFPETGEERILRAAREMCDLGMAFPILVGKPETITEFAQSLDISLEGIRIADNTDEAAVDGVIERYLKISQMHSAKSLKRQARIPLNFAVMLEAIGEADCTVAGLVHTTTEVILAAQNLIGMQEGMETISSWGVWSIPGWEGPDGNLLVHADCAVVVDPTAAELADIASASADTTAALLDIEPRVALLSFSTKGSGVHEKSERVVEALNIVRQRRPDLKVDGEFQVDSAIVPAVAARKVKEPSEVAGKANILIFPDLNAGNIGVKLVQIFGHADAFGPLLQGFAKPITDLSRGHSVEQIIGAATNVIVLAEGMSRKQ